MRKSHWRITHPLIRHAPHDTFSRFAREGARVSLLSRSGRSWPSRKRRLDEGRRAAVGIVTGISRAAIASQLAQAGYVADRDLSTALWMMDHLSRPLLIEGEAGVGKTEVAKALAKVHQCELIRMQCYEGLDANSALYEWNYQRQLLAIKAREGSGASVSEVEAQIFSESYLLERPLLASIRREKSPVLLVDEVDRADEEFEAFLLELLSDFQVTIP